MAGIASRLPHRLVIALTMVLALALAMPDTGDSRHKRPKRRTGTAGFADAFAAPASPVLSCAWQDSPFHDYLCNAGPGTLPFGLLVESADAPGPRPPGALQKNGEYNHPYAEGWGGPFPVANPDIALAFTCRWFGAPPPDLNADLWQCSFTYNTHTHLFRLSDMVSVAYRGDAGVDTTEQWVAPCDGIGPCPEQDPPPSTTLTAGPPDRVAARTATLLFTSSEAGSTFECRLDGESFAGCSAPKAYAGLAEGRHSFRVRATDDRGKIDETPARRDWLVDLSGPKVAISPRAVRLTLGGVARVSARCSRSELSGPCTGRLKLATAGRVSTRSGRRIVALGSKRFRLSPGLRATVRVRLSRPRRALVARLGSVRVQGTARARDSLENVRTSNRRFTLRAP
jgi:hypothetical protein